MRAYAERNQLDWRNWASVPRKLNNGTPGLSSPTTQVEYGQNKAVNGIHRYLIALSTGILYLIIEETLAALIKEWGLTLEMPYNLYIIIIILTEYLFVPCTSVNSGRLFLEFQKAMEHMRKSGNLSVVLINWLSGRAVEYGGISVEYME